MKIEYFGHSCFRLTNQTGARLLTDPYTQVGYELPVGLQTDIVTVSHGHFDHAYFTALQSGYLTINTPNEKRISGYSIVGVQTDHDPQGGALRGKNLVFCIQTDGITVCHFGDLGEAYRADLAEKFGNIDILLLPVGGRYTIDAGQAAEYVGKLAPKLVIPMHFKPQDGALDIAQIEPFLSLFKTEDILICESGVMELTAEDIKNQKTKILYMQRRK